MDEAPLLVGGIWMTLLRGDPAFGERTWSERRSSRLLESDWEAEPEPLPCLMCPTPMPRVRSILWIFAPVANATGVGHGVGDRRVFA